MTPHTVSPRTDDLVPVDDGVAPGWPDRFSARVDDRLTRMGLTSEFQRDCALAVLVVVGSTGLLAVLFADPGLIGAPGFEPFHVAAAIVVTSAQALLLCIRRVSPVPCLWVVALLQVVLLVVLPAGGTVRGVAPFIAAYTCGALLSGRRAARVVIGVAVFETVGVAAMNLVPGPATQLAADGPALSPAPAVALVTGQLLSSLLTYVAAAAVGAYVATRRRYVGLVRVRAAEAVESQRARADTAIGLERSRMARELHDVAAHHLSGMVVQAAVVERLIDRDPQAAKEAAAWIRAQGKETLHNLRLVVGALREPDERGSAGDPLGDGGAAPVPGLGVLHLLVATVRDLGTPVEFVREGDPRELPPIADVTFYRVAQEALSNARDHAPGAATRVLLHYREAEVSLEVVNELGPAPGPGGAATPSVGRRGFGLAGMGERAQMIGATFDAGPTPSGGWRVSLTRPLDREAPGTAALRERGSVADPGTGAAT